MFVVLTVLKTFFGGIIKFIFSDWRITLAVVLIVLAGLMYWQWNRMEAKLVAKQQELEHVQKNNEILKENNKTLHEANKQNEAVMEQIKREQKLTLETVNRLNKALAANNKKLNDVHVNLEKIKAPPVQLSPYFAEAINGIQGIESTPEAVTPTAVVTPTPAASAPKETKRSFLRQKLTARKATK